MKPIYLELCGINSFSEPAVIHFDELLDQGIFGIFGDTGSGKSTILDCIGFALYGSVSRDGASSADLINFRCDRGNVVFVFEIFFEGTRRIFRVEREIRRKKDGTATQSLVIYEQKEGKLIVREGGLREGNAFLQSVIGLKQEDFEKCIALPQGEFARFVKDTPTKRLEIISRLFDLERFGAELSRRASMRSAELTREKDILSARLEQYQGVSKEGIAAIQAEAEERAAADVRFGQALDEAREREKKLHALVEKRREFEKVAAEKELLESRREEMEGLEKELGRLEAARAVLAALREQNECEKLSVNADRRLSYASKRAESAAAAIAELPAFDEEAAAREIEALSALKGKAEAAFDAERERAEAQDRLTLCEEQFKALKAKTVDPDYERQLKELLALGENLGAGDLYQFLAAQRDALYRGEYETFAAELGKLEQKYPVISPDSRPLIERYTSLAEGEKLDFSDLKEAFERHESARKAAERARFDLENAQKIYLINKSKLDALSEKISSLRSQISSLGEKIAGAPDLKSLNEEIGRKRAAREKYLSLKASAEREKNAAEVELASSSAEAAARKDALKKAQERLLSLLGDFRDAEEARELLQRFGDADSAKRTLNAYRNRLAAALSKYEELKAEDLSAATEDGLLSLKAELSSLEEKRKENAGALAVLTETEKRFSAMLSEKGALEKEFSAKAKEAETAQTLCSILRGSKFMDFVSEEYLQTVAGNASVQLLSLTGKRYFLRYKTGVGFVVGDNFNGGELRAVSTLSGGETFLVSLSLALALSAEICARSSRPIEFFFLDEGFGTLDEKLVDTVMDSLEKLRSKSFSIGIISHVEELKHRIERKLLVTKATEERGSKITAE